MWLYIWVVGSFLNWHVASFANSKKLKLLLRILWPFGKTHTGSSCCWKETKLTKTKKRRRHEQMSKSVLEHWLVVRSYAKVMQILHWERKNLFWLHEITYVRSRMTAFFVFVRKALQKSLTFSISVLSV